MWYLTSEGDQRTLYVLPNKEITIGRSVDAQICNFAIPDDPSISRKHATLSISDNSLVIKDLGSRYGTFVNDEKLEGNPVKPNNNDVIKFGKMSSVWKVHQSKFVTCTSTLKGENLQNLKLCLGKLGATLKNEWDDSCAYLTMPAITLTIKVVLALAQGSHIVTTEFWNKCLEAVNKQIKLPDPDNFTPQVIESTLNKENVSFLPSDARKTLFAGKTVIFFSRRQLEMYKTVLTKCSANAILLSETKLTKSSLCNDDVIVVQYSLTITSQDTQAQINQINDILNYLKSKGKRVVPDAEIGLAILYCSKDKYCNPDFNFSSEVIKQNPGQLSKTSNILAQESQESTGKLRCKIDNVVINETLSSNSNTKRKLSEEDDIISNASKKVATDVISSNVCTNESGKRKFSDDNETQNPSKKMAIDDDDDDGDLFNFKTSTDNQNKTTDKKLNFSKPQKRKAESIKDEDDLFNFVQDKTKTGETSKESIFDGNKSRKINEELEADNVKAQKSVVEDKVDISALRGSKLKELMENNLNLNFDTTNMNIKEDPDDLDTKMNNLDLGTTIIKIRNDLVVKKEPSGIQIQSVENGNVKNFKKFRKVWPVKKQSFLSNSNVLVPDTPEMGSMSY